MPKYDPSVLTEEAERLYWHARLMAISWACRGILIGGFGAFLVTLQVRTDAWLAIKVAAGVCGIIGYSMGRQKGFALRLEAQRTLCLLQTEINGRKP